MSHLLSIFLCSRQFSKQIKYIKYFLHTSILQGCSHYQLHIINGKTEFQKLSEKIFQEGTDSDAYDIMSH